MIDPFGLPRNPPPPPKEEPPDEPFVYQLCVQVGGSLRIWPKEDLEKKTKDFMTNAVSDMLLRIQRCKVIPNGDHLLFVDTYDSQRIVPGNMEAEPS